MPIYNPPQTVTIPCRCGVTVEITLPLNGLITGDLEEKLEEEGWRVVDFTRDERGVMLEEFACPECIELHEQERAEEEAYQADVAETDRREAAAYAAGIVRSIKGGY